MIDKTSLDQRYADLYQDAATDAEAADRLCRVIAVLRRECPWDMVQTHESLRKCLLEEAYEACDAIDRKDAANLREELGDVLMQVILNSEIASETGKFTFTDVANEECEKMIRRHPHVFSTEEAKTVDKVLEKWENIKSKEHGNTSYAHRLNDVPLALPALLRSAKVQKRAADVGFDWSDISGPIAKVAEETSEFINADRIADRAAMQEELGDLFFSVVNVSRLAGFDPEETLNKATDKFIKRFEMLEKRAAADGRDLNDLSLAELDALWNEVKK